MKASLRPFLLLLCAASLAASARAQEAAPARPRLAAGADSNDAYAYYARGVEVIRNQPDVAAAAFWWSARLDPTWADPLYAYRAARILANRRLLDGMVNQRDKVLDSPEMLALDSIQLRATWLNPFVHRKFDGLMLRTHIMNELKPEVDRIRAERMGSGEFMLTDGEVEQYISQLFRDAGPRFRAWYAYGESRFVEAVKLYEREVSTARPSRRAEVRADLARAYFMAGNFPRALAEMQKAVGEWQARDAKELVRAYESKAIYEHGIGLLHEMRQQPDSAKLAYQRALQEDLAYWPAHRQLGMLSLATGDTATAVTALGQAVQLHEGDAGLRYTYAKALIAGGRYDDALAELKKSIELAPHFAEPYFLIARVYDVAEFFPQALEHYDGFLARASTRHQARTFAQQRRTTVAASAGAQAAPKNP